MQRAFALFRFRSSIYSSTRSFLSEAFECKEVWESRLNDPVLNKVNVQGLYYDLELQFNKTKKISPIDVDIFINSMSDNTYLTEVEELTHNLRRTAETNLTLPTTHHAFIRLFLTYKPDTLMRVLNDRINYGIFPDDYGTLLIIDHFLKQKDYKNASKIAALQMFQEDFTHPLVRYFALYSIHNYLLSSDPWVVEELKAEQEDDDVEEVKIRVGYIRTPWFDDHFDLVNGDHICGKSLAMIGSKLNDCMGRSYRAMGLALYNKWGKLEEYLENILVQDSSPLVYKESIRFIEDIIAKHLTDEIKLQFIKDLLDKVRSKNNNEESLLRDVELRLNDSISANEQEEIKNQETLYLEWNKLQNIKLAAHLDKLDKLKRLAEVEKRKKELALKEQKLFYFDNEGELELIVEEKSAELKKRADAASKDTSVEEDTYIPPEIKQRAED